MHSNKETSVLVHFQSEIKTEEADGESKREKNRKSRVVFSGGRFITLMTAVYWSISLTC